MESGGFSWGGCFEGNHGYSIDSLACRLYGMPARLRNVPEGLGHKKHWVRFGERISDYGTALQSAKQRWVTLSLWSAPVGDAGRKQRRVGFLLRSWHHARRRQRICGRRTVGMTVPRLAAGPVGCANDPPGTADTPLFSAPTAPASMAKQRRCPISLWADVELNGKDAPRIAASNGVSIYAEPDLPSSRKQER